MASAITKTWIRMLARITSLALLFVLFAPSDTFAQARNPVRAEHGMVVSTHFLASEVGRDVLARGGNAIDATVATALALAVVHPSAGNIGGGGFIVYHGADGEITSFNFREKAPAAATRDMYLDAEGGIRDNANHDGPLSVGVPGTVAGLALAHERLGSLPWGELVAPAIELAEQGFAVPWDWDWFMEAMAAQASDPWYAETARVFLNDGIPYETGDIIRQPDLAKTLRRIQTDGHDGFYAGETARLLAAYMEKMGGIITEADLAAYEAVEQPPVRGTFQGYDVISMAPPSSGGIALIQMLNMLEPYRLQSIGHNSALYTHLLTESMRRAFADRAYFIGDPAFNPNMPVSSLTSKDYAAGLRTSIDTTMATPSDSSTFNSALLGYESPETTHFSVVDGDGNAVSLTYTLEYSYGSRMTVEGAGFILNNEMGDFNPIPGVTTTTGLIGTDPNLVAPGKRMLSSMTPTIIARDGKPVLMIGSPGGRTIINTVLQVTLNVLVHDMNIAKAINAPRFHHQWLPDRLRLEGDGFSQDTVELLRGYGHHVDVRGTQGRAMGIYWDPYLEMWTGAADPRSPSGSAAAY